MRRHGALDSADGLGLHGHACWTYAADDRLAPAIADFLAEGVRLGQRLVFVGPVEGDALPAELAGLPRAGELRACGALEVVPLEAVYAEAGAAPAEDRLAAYAAATDRALADGYTGLRVAATVTPLVCEQADWDEHLRWESLADRFMAERPMAALCCYDRRVLPAETLADLCHLHPAAHAPRELGRFRLFAEPGATLVDGELDCFAADEFRRVLRAAVPAGGVHVVDLGELDFTDHHGVLALGEHARQLANGGGELRVRNAPYEVRRLSDLMDARLTFDA